MPIVQLRPKRSNRAITGTPDLDPRTGLPGDGNGIGYSFSNATQCAAYPEHLLFKTMCRNCIFVKICRLNTRTLNYLTSTICIAGSAFLLSYSEPTLAMGNEQLATTTRKIVSSITAQAVPEIIRQASGRIDDSTIYKTDRLTIRKLSEHVYQHISFMNTKDFGQVSCNGMFVENDGEVVVFDTPANDTSSMELIEFAVKNNWKIIGVIPTHFHEDCIAGLGVFQSRKIPGYAFSKTVKILKEKDNRIYTMLTAFDSTITLTIGSDRVSAEYFGEGHTRDNIVGYYSTDKVAFGGCLVKAVGATKGNLEDANVSEWSATVLKVKKHYPDAKIVVPGHGKTGGTELFDYTIELFNK